MAELLKIDQPFNLEADGVLPEVEITYQTYGRLSPQQDNVVWICHALTANADPVEWWPGLVGEGKFFDPEKYFIVCANILGSCYGTTGPASVNPETGKAYGRDFPLVTIRDMVRLHQQLRRHLGIERIALAIGGSMGAQQALEWSVIEPDVIDRICILASNAKHSPWGIAFNEAQRMAIAADPTYASNDPDAGKQGLAAARAIAMLSYRHYDAYGQTQKEESEEVLEEFKASSYQRYQGLKLERRFNVHAYVTLSKAMDSHNLGRGRKSIEAALASIKAKALIIGIDSDVLFPLSEQEFIARHIPGAHFTAINSSFGHDGFLIESERISALLGSWMAGRPITTPNRKRKKLNGMTAKNKIALPGSERF
jgi:homoserine O-acetyltransferase